MVFENVWEPSVLCRYVLSPAALYVGLMPLLFLKITIKIKTCSFVCWSRAFAESLIDNLNITSD